MSIRRKIAWGVIASVLACAWIVVIDHYWPSRADAVVTVCTENNPCQFPKASKGKYRQYRNDRIGRTSTGQIRNLINTPAKRKIKRAYRLWVIDQTVDPTATSARRIDFPSPRVWFRRLTNNIKCATVGASRTHWGTACSGFTSTWARKVNTAINEAVRVTIKCGGASVLGGLTQGGKTSIRREFGVAVRGGWGMAAWGGACMWNEYYDRWNPWR